MEMETRKQRGVSLFLMFLVLSLIYFVSTAFVFHTTKVEEAKYYSPKWFLENSNAKRPNLPFFNQTPPFINYTPTYLFEVRGDTRGYAWRFLVLSRYIEGYGWTLGKLRAEPYNMSASGNLSFLVRVAPLTTNYLINFPLITLWDIWRQDAFISAPTPYVTTISRFEYTVDKFEPDDMITLNVSSGEQGVIGFEYIVYSTPLDLGEIIGEFASVGETSSAAQADPELSYYLELPPDYFTRYPEVYELVENLTLGPEASVYDQATYIMAYLFSRFYVGASASIYWDPVANFITNGGGNPMGFVNVTAFILRAIGIPTRLILGFFGGKYSDSADITKYTVDDAFEWIEIWDKNIGWIPLWVYPLFTRTYNVLTSITMEINAPRSVYGYPAARLNDTVTISIILRGNFDPLEGMEVAIYDLNESVLIGTAQIQQIGTDIYQCAFGFKYDDLYSRLGIEPTYGRHVIAASMGSAVVLSELILLRTTIID